MTDNKEPDWMKTEPLGELIDERPEKCRSCNYDYWEDCQERCIIKESEKLIKQVIEIFNRYNFRNDIEKELRSLEFEEFFGDPDEKIYFTPNQPHEILVYVNWIDACFWIYKRIIKEDM